MLPFVFPRILHQVSEPLDEAGLNASEKNIFLLSCTQALRAMPAPDARAPSGKAGDPRPSHTSRMAAMRRDWVRFLMCVRLSLAILTEEGRGESTAAYYNTFLPAAE